MTIQESLQGCWKGKREDPKPREKGWGDKSPYRLVCGEEGCRPFICGIRERNAENSFKRLYQESNPIRPLLQRYDSTFISSSQPFPQFWAIVALNTARNGVFCWFSISSHAASGSNKVGGPSRKEGRKLCYLFDPKILFSFSEAGCTFIFDKKSQFVKIILFLCYQDISYWQPEFLDSGNWVTCYAMHFNF